MGSSPSIIEANTNLSEYVGETASLWNIGNKMYLSISDTMITGDIDSAMECHGSGELTGLSIELVEHKSPGYLFGSYIRRDYVLTVRFLHLTDQIIGSSRGFTLTKKSNSGDLFVSRVGV